MKKKVKKKKKELFKLIIILVATIVILYLLFKVAPILDSQSEKINRMNCPYKVEGNLNATLVIKYIDSPYCFWCWIEEPILKKLVATKGNSFKLERYDIRYCTDIVRKYGFAGTPSFVFSFGDGIKEFIHSGFIDEQGLNRIICGVTEDCENDS